jgi:hypothetical protein
MSNDGNDKFDWFEWAGINPSDFDDLVTKANEKNVPVFANDNEESLFNRLLSVQTCKNNLQTTRVNIALAAISFVSAIGSLMMVFL